MVLLSCPLYVVHKYQKVGKCIYPLFCILWIAIVVHLFEIYGGIICPLLGKKWIGYMPIKS